MYTLLVIKNIAIKVIKTVDVLLPVREYVLTLKDKLELIWYD
jgi:hypothetical protein